jgi:hypothetical protein
VTTRVDRERWRQVLAGTPTETALVTIRAGKLRALLDALDAAETCHADCEERVSTAEARAMAAEGERDELLREAAARARVLHHTGPCTSDLPHPADVARPRLADHAPECSSRLPSKFACDCPASR